MRNVLFVGDVNVDIIMGDLETQPIIDREVTCASFTLTLGSSVVIAAANYVGLGGTAAVAGLVGGDEYGRFMINGMNKRGIDTRLVQQTTTVSTGVTVNLIHGTTRTQITYPGTISEFCDTTMIETDINQFSHFHFSGLYQQHRFRPRLTPLLEKIRRAGATISIDPQWDPQEKWEFMDEWLPHIDVFFVNEDEARSITGSRNIETALEKLVRRTPCPICKLGSNGVLIWSNGASLHIPPYPVTVVDTTGAGDAFAAGTLYARIEKGMDLVDTVQFANAVAARNCMAKGGVNSCPSFAEILHFMETHRE